jgi:VCBS repeat-containing protein
VYGLSIAGNGNGSRPAGLTDAALQAMLSVDPGNVIDNAHTTGTIHWNFDSNPQAFDFLATGETLQLTYTIRATDSDAGHATGDQTVVVNITGTNDAPHIAADTSGTLSTNVHDLTESDAALTASGTLAVSDADVSNTVTASVYGLNVGGTGNGSRPAGLTDTALQAMLSVDTGNVTDNAHTTGAIHWNFDSNPQAFDFLADGETLQLTYTIRATDSDFSHATGDQTVVINIAGTNDAPAINAIAQQDLTEQTDTNPLTSVTPVTFADADRSDAGHTAQIIHASASGATAGLLLDDAALMTLMTPQFLVEPTGSSPGSLSLHFAADSTAFDYLVDTEVVTLAYTLEIDDHHGGVTTQTSLVAITGVSDFHLI